MNGSSTKGKSSSLRNPLRASMKGVALASIHSPTWRFHPGALSTIKPRLESYGGEVELLKNTFIKYNYNILKNFN